MIAAYYRTSSQTNVGEDKDSLRRQREAVRAYAEKEGLEISAEFHDVISGASPVDQRPEFRRMLSQGPTMILVENASRFARDLIVQLTGHKLLQDQGIEVVPVDCPGHFTEDTPTATMIRQILGAVSEFEKAQLVYRLRVARERSGRFGGRRPVPAEVVARVRVLRGDRVPFRQASEILAAEGFLNERGNPYDPRSLQRVA